jgi:multimeric flavodoxin WrbA
VSLLTWERWQIYAVVPKTIRMAHMTSSSLKVFGLNCSLKSSSDDETSSTEALMKQLFAVLAENGARGDIVRAADHNIKPGVTADEGDGDAWPLLLKKVLAADILVAGCLVWLCQPSSVAKRVLERMDAFSG